VHNVLNHCKYNFVLVYVHRYQQSFLHIAIVIVVRLLLALHVCCKLHIFDRQKLNSSSARNQVCCALLTVTVVKQPHIVMLNIEDTYGDCSMLHLVYCL
jgi:hypothetical protein